MKPRIPKKPQAVVVEWDDSWAAPSTKQFDIVEELQERGGEPIRIVQVGFLMRRDDDGVLLAGSLIHDDDNEGISRASHVAFIPAAMVVSVKRLVTK